MDSNYGSSKIGNHDQTWQTSRELPFFSRFMDDIDAWSSAAEFIAGFFVYFCQGQITLPSGLSKERFPDW